MLRHTDDRYSYCRDIEFNPFIDVFNYWFSDLRFFASFHIFIIFPSFFFRVLNWKLGWFYINFFLCTPSIDLTTTTIKIIISWKWYSWKLNKSIHLKALKLNKPLGKIKHIKNRYFSFITKSWVLIKWNFSGSKIRFRERVRGEFINLYPPPQPPTPRKQSINLPIKSRGVCSHITAE